MKKLLFAALSIEAVTLLVRACHAAAPLPDWILRLNGIIMLAAALLAFASARLNVKSS